MQTACLCVLLICLFSSSALAHGNGMDMSMDHGPSLASGHMRMYLHYTPGDILLFEGWVPQSAGAMIGACIGLFLLAVVERWVAMCSAVMTAHWNKRGQIAYADKLNRAGLPTLTSPSAGSAPRPSSSWDVITNSVTFRTALPFIPAHDLMRGVLRIGQAALEIVFMLAVMTYQVGFILSIVVGLGVGETLFGRFATGAIYH